VCAKKINLQLPPADLARLTRLAEATGTTVQALIRACVTLALSHIEGQVSRS
jgi:hypothetical protein